MGCFQNGVFCHRHRQFALSFLVLLIYSSSHLRLFSAEGRILLSQTAHNSKGVNEESKAILRGRIGSRPPMCERRCSSCGHCEAIQVPTNPQVRRRRGEKITKSSSSSVSVVTRGDDNSNYKPMSWKCKCGSLIFNP